MESYFNLPFPRKRPILFPKTNGRIELDGYNEQNKIAFEYQDYSHYKPFWKDIKHFGLEKAEYLLKERQNRDAFKIKWTQEKGIYLIIIPYWISEKEWDNEIKRQMDFIKEKTTE